MSPNAVQPIPLLQNPSVATYGTGGGGRGGGPSSDTIEPELTPEDAV
jgi:hypothetical protein